MLQGAELLCRLVSLEYIFFRCILIELEYANSQVCRAVCDSDNATITFALSVCIVNM
jgi:hypothetical protein